MTNQLPENKKPQPCESPNEQQMYKYELAEMLKVSMSTLGILLNKIYFKEINEDGEIYRKNDKILYPKVLKKIGYLLGYCDLHITPTTLPTDKQQKPE